MPNWTTSEIEFSGDKAKLSELFEIIAPDGKFSFENIIPMPPDLKIESGYRLNLGMAILGQTATPEQTNEFYQFPFAEQNEILGLGKKGLSNIENYQFKDWYDWSVARWGTKWDAADAIVDNDLFTITFNTAWNAPIPIFEELHKQFPDIPFYVTFVHDDLSLDPGEIVVNENEFSVNFFPAGSETAEDIQLSLIGVSLNTEEQE